MEVPIGIGMEEAGFKAMIRTPFPEDDLVIVSFQYFGIHHAKTLGAEAPCHFQKNVLPTFPWILKYICMFRWEHRLPCLSEDY